jgi:hypothetical protein
MIQNDLFLRAHRGDSIERYPVWLMRQAGRILPEYRAVRSKLSGFKELVETPAFATEVTVQPVDLLDVDAAVRLMQDFDSETPMFAIIKHNNACGFATRDDGSGGSPHTTHPGQGQ